MWEAIGGVGFGLIAGLLAWYAADVRSKQRLVFVEERMRKVEDKQDDYSTVAQQRLGKLDERVLMCDQDRVDLRRSIDRIDATKASKEVVDGIRNDISGLKMDIDKRFDKLERMLENRHHE